MRPGAGVDHRQTLLNSLPVAKAVAFLVGLWIGLDPVQYEICRDLIAVGIVLGFVTLLVKSRNGPKAGGPGDRRLGGCGATARRRSLAAGSVHLCRRCQNAMDDRTRVE